MNSAEAKRILIAHRERHASATDADVMAALEQAGRDPALAEWWQRQAALHETLARQFASIPVPDSLREEIRLRSKVVPLPWRQRNRAWAMAAAAAIVLTLALAVFYRGGRPDGEGFPTFRSRMVGAVLRQYRMDIQTNNMAAIRQFLGERQAPADYTVPSGARELPPMGAGVLKWRASPVSMVCLDARGQGTVFLFVVDRAAVTQAPGSTPQFAQVNRLMTASWAEGEKVYLLAFLGEAAELRKFL